MNEPCKCGTQFCKHHKAQVWSCGGGTQSCAIAALIVQGKLPKPDFSVIADTGYETGATWEFMDRVLVPELAKVGVTLVRIFAKEWAYHSNSVMHQTKPNGKPLAWSTPICGYSTENGIAKMPNLCSTQWKGEPIQRWLSKTHRITKSKACIWIGFSSDEQRRILKRMKSEDFQKGYNRFPLVELFMNRPDCIKLVESMGWGTPPRSSCYMCPNHSDHEWRKLIAERPDEFQKAVEIEREIHKVDPDAWLHRSCVPLDQVDFSQPEDLFSRPCDSGLCFV